jgi:hypothetical protein
VPVYAVCGGPAGDALCVVCALDEAEAVMMADRAFDLVDEHGHLISVHVRPALDDEIAWLAADDEDGLPRLMAERPACL